MGRAGVPEVSTGHVTMSHVRDDMTRAVARRTAGPAESGSLQRSGRTPLLRPTLSSPNRSR